MAANRGRSVVIVGAGIGGLTAALCFARSGAEVTVLEQAPALTEVGAGLQITPNGAAVLAALGLDLDACMIRGKAVEPMDAVSGRRLARFDLTGLPGQPYRFCHRAELIDLLANAARQAGVQLRTGVRVDTIDPHGRIGLGSGGSLLPTLAVGADGLQSRLRVALNGADAAFFTGQTAWRAMIQGDAPAVARIWMAPGRHVVSYPLTGGRINLVAVREQAAWAAAGWHHPDDPANLRAAFAGLCPELTDLLAGVEAASLWGLFRHPVAAHWVGPAAALLGDAAHPTLPFLAQGANLAIEDAWVLAAACNADPGLQRALAVYQAQRQQRVVRAIAAADANARAYHLRGPRRIVAQAGLRALGALAPRLFLRRLAWLYGLDVTAARDGIQLR